MVWSTKDTPQRDGGLQYDRAHLALEDALSTLPFETRAAVWLYAVEREAVPDIADCLGCSPSAAHRRIRSGLANLRIAMERRGQPLARDATLVALLRDLAQPEPPATLHARLTEVAERCGYPRER